MPDRLRLMLVGTFAAGALEHSYQSAFVEVGCEVAVFDMAEAVRRCVRLGRFGAYWNRFLPVEPWIAKANREMVLAAFAFKPDIVVVVGQNLVRAGALAQVRAMRPIRTVIIWQDTMVFLGGQTIQCLPLYDLVATYSRESVPLFLRLGAPDAEWIPLAADPKMHASPVGPSTSEFQADVGFIGQWRPERESALARLIAEAPELSVKIWGPDWGRRCKGKKSLLAAWQGRSLFRSAFSQAVAGCKISLNVIDPTNFPAANMRFFELPVLRGVQVSSRCPEMEAVFRHGDAIFYYQSEEQLPSLVRSLVSNPALRARVGETARAQVLAAHTYAHRAGAILDRLNVVQA
jgi:spore maturation protein CgeB